MSEALVREFVLGYLAEIEADVRDEGGVYAVTFPPGRKRRFGGERRFTFDPTKSAPHVEVLEPGSPLLKMMVLDAKQWGGLGCYATDQYPNGTLVFTFQFTTFSSLKKRSKFATAFLLPDATTPRVVEGVPEFFSAPQPAEPVGSRDVGRFQDALPMVHGAVEAAGRTFAHDAVVESDEAFRKSLGRLTEYFQGLRQETATEEARIRKRLGEIQSKLYFTEDGLRQLKLEKERDRLTQELYDLKKKRTASEEKLTGDQVEHIEKQRRRHEPKLHLRLVAATLIQPRAPRPAPAPAPTGVTPPL